MSAIVNHEPIATTRDDRPKTADWLLDASRIMHDHIVVTMMVTRLMTTATTMTVGMMIRVMDGSRVIDDDEMALVYSIHSSLYHMCMTMLILSISRLQQIVEHIINTMYRRLIL